MVIDELILRENGERHLIDSYDNQMIDEIVYEGNTYHFAKQKDLVGETSIIADNAVQEPMVSLELQGNTEQQTYEGYNLFDISKVNGANRATTTTPDVAGNVAYGTITDGVLNLAYGYYDRNVIWTGSKILIKQGGKYNILFDFMCESSMNGTYDVIRVDFRNFTKGEAKGFAYIKDDNVRDIWQVKTPQKSIEIPDTWVGDNVYLQLQVLGNKNQYSKMPIYAKNIIISYNEAKPYEPYVGGIASPNPEYPQEIKSCNSSILPSAYQQVEYIESTGTQYIDTGFKPNQNTKVELKCQYISLDSSSIFGSNPYFVLTTGESRFRYRYNSNSLSLYDSASILAKLTLDKNKAYLNDELVGTFTEATFQSPYNALLFARSTSSGGIEEKCSAKLYYAKLWDNNVLIRDYVPCYRKNDGVIGLYDLANGVFYTNGGTGTFTKGKEISTMSATIRGVNLFALGESNYTVGRVYTNAGITYTVQADGGIRCKGTKTSSYSYFIFMAGAYIRKYGQGTYSLGMYGENIPSKIEMEFRKFNANGVSIQTGLARAGIPVTRTLVEGETLERFSVIVLTEGEVDFVVYPMLNIGEPLPYQPYFNNTIEIPPSVTLDDGTELALGFEKLGNYANKLTIDRVNGKVTYLQNCKTVEYDSSRYFVLANVDVSNERQQFTTYVGGVLLEENNPVAKCSHLPYNRNSYNGNMVAFIPLKGAITQTMPRSVLIPFGFVAGTSSTYVPAFKAWLQDQKDKGTPFTVCVVAKPTEYDLTNTELGARLLQVAKTEKGTNIVEITSELPVSKTEISYWRQIIPGESL